MPTKELYNKGFMNQDYLPTLMYALCDQLECSKYILPNMLKDNHYVIEGEFLLQRIP